MQPPTGVDSLYDTAVQGRDMVTVIMRNVAQSGSFFVQFYDSKQVHSCTFSGASGPVLTLAASPTPAPPPAVVAAALGDRHHTFWAKRHITHGDVYVFDARDRTLVLVDSDKNGVLDGSIVVSTEQEWESLGFSASANYQQ